MMYTRTFWFSPIRPKDAFIYIPSKLIKKKLTNSQENLYLHFTPSMAKMKKADGGGLELFQSTGEDIHPQNLTSSTLGDQLTIQNVYPYYTNLMKRKKSPQGNRLNGDNRLHYRESTHLIIKYFDQIDWSICGSYHIISVKGPADGDGSVITIIAQILVNVCDMEQRLILKESENVRIPLPIILKGNHSKSTPTKKEKETDVPVFEFRLIQQKVPYQPHEEKMVKYVNKRMKVFREVLNGGDYDATRHSGNSDKGERDIFINSVMNLGLILYGNDPVYSNRIQRVLRSYIGIRIPPKDVLETFTLVSLSNVSEVVSFLFSLLIFENKSSSERWKSNSDGKFTNWNDVRTCVQSVINSFKSQSAKRNISNLFVQMTLEVSHGCPVPIYDASGVTVVVDEYQEYRLVSEPSEEIKEILIDKADPVIHHGNYILQYRLRSLSTNLRGINDKHGRNTEWKCFTEYRLIIAPSRDDANPFAFALGNHQKVNHFPDSIPLEFETKQTMIVDGVDTTKLSISRYSSNSINVPFYSATNLFTAYNDVRYIPDVPIATNVNNTKAPENPKEQIKEKEEIPEKKEQPSTGLLSGIVQKTLQTAGNLVPWKGRGDSGNKDDSRPIIHIKSPEEEALSRTSDFVSLGGGNADANEFLWYVSGISRSPIGERLQIRLSHILEDLSTDSKLFVRWLNARNQEIGSFREFVKHLNSSLLFLTQTGTQKLDDAASEYFKSRDFEKFTHEKKDHQVVVDRLFDSIKDSEGNELVEKDSESEENDRKFVEFKTVSDNTVVEIDLNIGQTQPRYSKFYNIFQNQAIIDKEQAATGKFVDISGLYNLVMFDIGDGAIFSRISWYDQDMLFRRWMRIEVDANGIGKAQVISNENIYQILSSKNTNQYYQSTLGSRIPNLFEKKVWYISRPVLEWNFSLLDEADKGIRNTLVALMQTDKFYPQLVATVPDQNRRRQQTNSSIQRLYDNSVSNIPNVQIDFLNTFNELMNKNPREINPMNLSSKLQNGFVRWNTLMKDTEALISEMSNMSIVSITPPLVSGNVQKFLGCLGVSFEAHSLSKKLHEMALSDVLPEIQITVMGVGIKSRRNVAKLYDKSNIDVAEIIYNCFQFHEIRQLKDDFKRWVEKLKNVPFKESQCKLYVSHLDTDKSIPRVSPYLSLFGQNILGDDHALRNNLGSLEILFSRPFIGPPPPQQQKTVESPTIALGKRSLFKDSALGLIPVVGGGEFSRVILRKPYIQSNSTYYSPLWVKKSEQADPFLRDLEQYLKCNKGEIESELGELYRKIGEAIKTIQTPVTQYSSDNSSVLFRIYLSLVDLIEDVVVEKKNSPVHLGSLSLLIYSLLVFINESGSFNEHVSGTISQDERAKLYYVIKSMLDRSQVENIIKTLPTKYNSYFISVIANEVLYRFLFTSVGNMNLFNPLHVVRFPWGRDPPRITDQYDILSGYSTMVPRGVETYQSSLFPLYIYNEKYAKEILISQRTQFRNENSLSKMTTFDDLINAISFENGGLEIDTINNTLEKLADAIEHFRKMIDPLNSKPFFGGNKEIKTLSDMDENEQTEVFSRTRMDCLNFVFHSLLRDLLSKPQQLDEAALESILHKDVDFFNRRFEYIQSVISNFKKQECEIGAEPKLLPLSEIDKNK